jgi:hypothetical protein
MWMPGERVALQVFFGRLRRTRPVGSPPVSLHSLMRKDALLLKKHLSYTSVKQQGK